jgi:16S rRNA (cytosine967-C5)-methyltransferase
LENAASLVVNGGTIVYSTCTTEPEENEYQIERFLSKHDNFSLEHGKYLLPAKLITDSGYFSTSPHNFNMDGAFAVRIRRNR